jgi:hypothetical protein
MINSSTNHRVLIVTPEITYLPKGRGNISSGLNAKAGGLAAASVAGQYVVTHIRPSHKINNLFFCFKK